MTWIVAGGGPPRSMPHALSAHVVHLFERLRVPGTQRDHQSNDDQHDADREQRILLRPESIVAEAQRIGECHEHARQDSGDCDQDAHLPFRHAVRRLLRILGQGRARSVDVPRNAVAEDVRLE